MLNYVWFFLLVLGIFIGMLNGRMEAVTQAVIQSSSTAVQLCIGLLGVMCLWSGIMNIAEKSGLVRIIGRVVRPVLHFLFPDVPSRHPAAGAIVMNLVANFLGLGNAATPLGLKAMNELQRLNPHKDTATDAMCMFLVLNTASLQLIPATTIAIRAAAGSASSTEIIGTVWIASACALITGIIAARIMNRLMR